MKQRCQAILIDYVEVKDYKYISEKDIFPQSIFVKTIDVLSSGSLLIKLRLITA